MVLQHEAFVGRVSKELFHAALISAIRYFGNEPGGRPFVAVAYGVVITDFGTRCNGPESDEWLCSIRSLTSSLIKIVVGEAEPPARLNGRGGWDDNMVADLCRCANQQTFPPPERPARAEFQPFADPER
jgi:hypothetical protein